MKYMALIYGNEEAWDALSEEEQQRVTQRYMALAREPVTVGGDELEDPDTATTVRVRDGERRSPPTGRSRRRRSSSAATTSSTARASTRRSSSRRGSRQPSEARSR